MNIRMIVSDIDGTLIPGGGTLSERTKRVLKACEEKGVYVVLASGRTFYGAHMFYWTVRIYEDLKAAEREGAQAIFEGFDPDGAERKSERKEDTP